MDDGLNCPYIWDGEVYGRCSRCKENEMFVPDLWAYWERGMITPYNRAVYIDALEKKLEKAVRGVNSLRAENAQLRAALEPFATTHADLVKIHGKRYVCRIVEYGIQGRDLRRAAEVMEEVGDG